MTQTDKQAHTPGPWTSIHGAPKADLEGVMVSVPIRTPRGQFVISCSGLPAPGEMQANARLIAAAPNLLAACERVVEMAVEKGERAVKVMRTSHGKYAAATVKDDSSQYIRAVKAAITKAKAS